MATAQTTLTLTDISCCTPVVSGVLGVAEAERLAKLLKAVADPTRLRLLSIVAAHDGGEACVCDLTEPVGLTQGTVSHHMKVLVDAGILTREQRGKWAYYALVPDALNSLAAVISVEGTGNRR
jgi:ArsR family transcriptional regulator, arsenate/arsenite/antimonite-responsive transcriptional repressor